MIRVLREQLLPARCRARLPSPTSPPSRWRRAGPRGGAAEAPNSPGVITQPSAAPTVPGRKRIARVDVIGVPMDLGADRRGVDMGPSAIRYARLKESLERLGIEVTDRGNLRVPVPESASTAEQNAKYFPIIQAVCEELAGVVDGVIARRRLSARARRRPFDRDGHARRRRARARPGARA